MQLFIEAVPGILTLSIASSLLRAGSPHNSHMQILVTHVSRLIQTPPPLSQLDFRGIIEIYKVAGHFKLIMEVIQAYFGRKYIFFLAAIGWTNQPQVRDSGSGTPLNEGVPEDIVDRSNLSGRCKRLNSCSVSCQCKWSCFGSEV